MSMEKNNVYHDYVYMHAGTRDLIHDARVMHLTWDEARMIARKIHSDNVAEKKKDKYIDDKDFEYGAIVYNEFDNHDILIGIHEDETIYFFKVEDELEEYYNGKNLSKEEFRKIFELRAEDLSLKIADMCKKIM